MRSKDRPVKPVYAQKVPVLSPEVASKTIDNCFVIHPPRPEQSSLFVDDVEKCKTYKFKCQSLYMRNGDIMHCCNSTVKTIIGDGSGDQTEIVECGKCRTSYLIRTRYIDGKLVVNSSVWDTSRNIKNFSYRESNENADYIVKFYTKQN